MSVETACLSELERLIDSLLYEGYALYPYTPGATKNATPTPFGIVYPPVYAAELASTFDHLELRCVLRAPPEALLSAEVRFLVASGERHEAVAHRLQLEEMTLASLAEGSAGGERGAVREDSIAGGAGGLRVHLSLNAHELGDDSYEVALSVENRTPCAQGLDRRAALAHSLLSTHPVMRVSGGRFSSPLEQPVRKRQHLPRARERRRRRSARRCDRSTRSPPDRPREPRRPVRLDRDRGGAAAASCRC